MNIQLNSVQYEYEIKKTQTHSRAITKQTTSSQNNNVYDKQNNNNSNKQLFHRQNKYAIVVVKVGKKL